MFSEAIVFNAVRDNRSFPTPYNEGKSPKEEDAMFGAICGDIIGSAYEGSLFLTGNEPLFVEGATSYTDDTILTCAIADWLLNSEQACCDVLRRYFNQYGKRELYGEWFKSWALQIANEAPKSTSNGAAMRISPLLGLSDIEEQTLVCRKITRMTHDSDEAEKGALAILAACRCDSKSDVKKILEHVYPYKSKLRIKDFQNDQYFETSCDDTVPKALIAVLESNHFEEVMRNCLKIGGDVDTIACMAGSISERVFGIPMNLGNRAMTELPDEFVKLISRFYSTYWGKAWPALVDNYIPPKDTSRPPFLSKMRELFG